MTQTNETVVRELYRVYNARDWDTFRAMIADGFTFTSPYDDAIDIEAYRKRCWPPGDNNRAFDVERVAGDPDGAFITYLLTTKAGMSFRNTEYLTVTRGKVIAVNVYFGASYRDGTFVAKTPD